MVNQRLLDKVVMITGAAKRIGRLFALACAREGADIIIHHGHSDNEAEILAKEIQELGRQSWVYKADLSAMDQTETLTNEINKVTPIHFLVNNASIFEPTTFNSTSVEQWNDHLQINLTAPFLISQSFARQAEKRSRIVNILDWRALRPGPDHFPYTITKSALAAMTKSMAAALAPKIMVNGLALGAILPPLDQDTDPDLISKIPLKRWAHEGEAEEGLIFLLTCPEYITGEIIHIDGGRHLM